MDIIPADTANYVVSILSVIYRTTIYGSIYYANGAFTTFTNIRHYLFIPKKTIQIEYI